MNTETSENLKPLLNKLVELKTDKDHMKGFLFHENNKYYIKPIEVYKGGAVETIKFWLQPEHEGFTKFCESPKLMKISMKSWHYRLIRYILGNNAPTPKTMQNGCPYFWLLIFCLIVSPIVMFFHGVGKAFMAFPYLFYAIIEGLTMLELKFMDDDDSFYIDDYGRGGYSGNYSMAPIITKIYFKRTQANFMKTFIKARYGIDSIKDPVAYAIKVSEIKKKVEELNAKHEAARQIRSAQEDVAEKIRDRKKWERERLNRERKRKHDELWRPFNQRMDKIKDGIVKAMTFDYKNSTIIKRTKAFIGFLISLLVLACTCIVVGNLTWLIVSMVDGVIWLFAVHGIMIVKIFLGILIGAALIGIGFLLFNWAQTVILKYEHGKKTWYVQGFVYAIINPIQYLILGIIWFVCNIIGVPAKYIFYNIVWNWILVSIGIFIWGILRAFGGTLIGSLGIFGEYFGASKKDYCPGIEWTDTSEY